MYTQEATPTTCGQNNFKKYRRGVENRQNPQKPVYYMSTGIISEHAL
jgi:hypothetical protein